MRDRYENCDRRDRYANGNAGTGMKMGAENGDGCIRAGLDDIIIP